MPTGEAGADHDMARDVAAEVVTDGATTVFASVKAHER